MRNASAETASPPVGTVRSSRPLRIAWIGGRGVPERAELGGGIERSMEELGPRLVARGHELTVYCRAYYTPEAGDYAGMHRCVLPTIRSKHLDTIVHTALATAHALGRRYDIVQYFALGPSLLAPVPRLAGSRTIASVRARDWQRQKWGRVARAVLRLGERSAVCWADASYSVSRPLSELLEQRYRRRVYYIPNGITPPPVRSAASLRGLDLTPGGYLLFVGRLVPEKGCHDLVRAFRQVRTDKALVVAGAPSYSEAYVAELHRLADARVRFLGHVARPLLDDLYTHAYLCILPSYVEGMSNALLEALSHRRCVLISDIPENLAVAGDYCPTFRRGNVGDLVGALTRLVNAPATVATVGARAGQFVLRRYSWDRVAEAVEALYLALMTSERRGRGVDDLDQADGSVVSGGSTPHRPSRIQSVS
jgi:glycosyltransferase involved in cell wall biosynthesis